MDKITDAAYIISQSACAMIEALGMQAENKKREMNGESMAYNEGSFNDVIEKYGIYHNATVTQLFQG